MKLQNVSTQQNNVIAIKLVIEGLALASLFFFRKFRKMPLKNACRQLSADVLYLFRFHFFLLKTYTQTRINPVAIVMATPNIKPCGM